MKSKKGVDDIVQNILLGAVIAIPIILAIMYASNTLGDILHKSSTNVACTNAQWWEKPGNLRSILKNVDTDESKGEFFFYNDNCNLVSFSFTQGINEIPYPGVQPRQPVICLCKIERELISREPTCKPYDCYTFKNIDEINHEQLSTEDLKPYVFLKFIKNGKNLIIEPLSDQKAADPIEYIKKENTELDKIGLVNNLMLLFKTRKIRAFVPIIKLKEDSLVQPEGIPENKVPILGFTIDLVIPDETRINLQDYKQTHQEIKSDLIKGADIELNILENKVSKISTETELFYKQGNNWESTKLLCTSKEKKIMCRGVTLGFSNDFLIMTNKKEEKKNE